MIRRMMVLAVIITTVQVAAQILPAAGPHARQEALQPGAQANVPYMPAAQVAKAGNTILTHKVMGYHPYWRSDDNIAAYRFDLLTHVVYFSAGVDPATGEITTTRDWLTTPLVAAAHNAGCKVHLCVTNFGTGNNLNLLQNPEARDTLIAQLIRLVQARGGDGINLDFESMPGAARDDLVTFCRDLDERLETAIPGAEISSAMPAVDWNNAWDVAELAKYIDLFFLMCYDYYWSGSANAGPVSPIIGSSYNVTRTVDWYLTEGVPKEQILMGVPYYGFDWPVVSDQPNAATEAKATAYIYTSVQNGLKQYDRLWSAKFLNPWYKYQTASYWHQTWFDDVESLGYKYDLALDREIGGIGMWALSYDNGHDELWQLIEEKFTAPLATDEPGAVTGLHLGDIWPNPAGNGPLYAAYTTGLQPEAPYYRVTDYLGRSVLDGRLQSPSTAGTLTIPTHQLAPGTYRLELRLGNKHTAKTFVVAR